MATDLNYLKQEYHFDLHVTFCYPKAATSPGTLKFLISIVNLEIKAIDLRPLVWNRKYQVYEI